MNFNKYYKEIKKYDVFIFKYDKWKSLKKLKIKKSKSLGRNNGQIVSNHRGGGVKRLYRLINFYKHPSKFGILRSIEYDPNRSSFIGLIQFNNGSFSYIIVPSKSKVGDVFNFRSLNFFFKNGDTTKLLNIPSRVPICNIENSFKSSTYSKAAGVVSYVISKSEKFAKILLPSGKERFLDLNNLATIGKPSNIFNKTHNKYKAGNNRLLNKRPKVRGVAMNPVDHPHGGGEGKTSGGRPSVTPWGKITKGLRTSKNRFRKNKFILQVKNK